MKKLLAIITAASASLMGYAGVYGGKTIYIPKDLQASGIESDTAKWSVSRMVSTENVALFWAPGFGGNISTAPELEGHNMRVDIGRLLERLEEFYHVFRDDLKFVSPGSKSERYKMMVMLDYSLEGTVYGGDYDSEIGALWIAPNRVQDKKLNCIAHELGHSFQMQIIADGQGDGWGGSGFYEMASQWMLWQVNPDWPTDENYHLNAYRDNTHKAFLHIDNIYRSPYVLELWGEKYGLPYIAELFRQGKVGEDPVTTHCRMQGMSQKEFNDEMFEIQRRFITWDIDRVREQMTPYRNLWNTRLENAGGWQRVEASQAPENYGFNAIALSVPAPGQTVSVRFKGDAGRRDCYIPNPREAGWRYGLVAYDKNGNTHYGEMMSDPDGRVSWTAPADVEITNMWLMVMGAPTVHRQNIDGPDNPGDPQWPYRIKVKIK